MEALFSGIVSFSLFHIISHPKSRINKKFPIKKLRRFQFFPHINFSSKKHVIHFHHWMLILPLLVISQSADKGIMSTAVVKGSLIGAFIQGLLYQDRFKIIFKRNEYFKIRNSGYHFASLVRFWKKK